MSQENLIETTRRSMDQIHIKFDVQEQMRKLGLRLNPTSSVEEPIGQFDAVSVDVCDFCKAKIEQVPSEGKDLWEYGRFRDAPCTCPENQANTAKYDQTYREVYERVSAEYKRIRVEELHIASKTPARFLERTFARFNVTPSNQKAYEAALKYAKEFDPKRGDGLLLSGTVGTGKTHLAAAVALELMEQEHKVVFGTVNTLLSEIRYSFNDERAESEAELFKRYTTCDMLVIDDLGKEKVSDWVEQVIFDIINSRYENNKSLIITTNLGLQEIRLKYHENGDALVDRILEMCKGIKIEGDSWRRKGLA